MLSSKVRFRARWLTVALGLVLTALLAACRPTAPQATQAPPVTMPPTEAPLPTAQATQAPPPTMPPTEVPLPTTQPTEVLPTPTPPEPETPAIDGASLLDTRCSACHSANRAKTAQKTQAEWEQTVTRMISHGAELSEEEKAALVGYLAKNYGR